MMIYNGKIFAKIINNFENNYFSQFTKSTKIIYLPYFFILKMLTPFLVFFFPSFISWFFDFGRNIRRLPKRSERINKELNVLDEFVFLNYNSPRFEEVNICLGGNIQDVRDPKLPTFFVNPRKIIPNKFKNKYFITGDRLVFRAMMGLPVNDCYKRFTKYKNDRRMYILPFGPWLKNFSGQHFSDNNDLLELRKLIEDHRDGTDYDDKYIISACIHKYNGSNIQIGSGIVCIFSMLELSKKVNVYGWDSFLEGEMPNNFIGQTKKLWSNFNDFHPGSRFASIVFNWIYAYRLINEFESSRLTVHGRVNDISKFLWIKNYLFKVIYK